MAPTKRPAARAKRATGATATRRASTSPTPDQIALYKACRASLSVGMTPAAAAKLWSTLNNANRNFNVQTFLAQQASPMGMQPAAIRRGTTARKAAGTTTRKATGGRKIAAKPASARSASAKRGAATRARNARNNQAGMPQQQHAGAAE